MRVFTPEQVRGLMVSVEDGSLKWWISGDREVEAHVGQEAGRGLDLAVDRLVADYSALLFRVAHSVVRNAAEAEDIVQDTFVRVLQSRADLPAIREMRLWLVRIAWNLALDRRRRVRPEQIDDLFLGTLAGREASADRAFSDAQQLGRVLREMERLPNAERHALLLSAVEEMSTADIAEVLKKSESAVRALVFRARTRLRERCASRRKGERP